MTLIYAHRGYNKKFPENTMLSFEKALEANADGIELDVHLSLDEEVVVIHDDTVNRTTNGKGKVKGFTVEQLKALHKQRNFFRKVKEEIPTLVEVLDWIKPTNLLLNIELKNNQHAYRGLEEKVISLVHYYGLAERTVLSSFNHYSLVYCRYLAPEIETAPLYSANIYEPWKYAKTMLAQSIHPKITNVSAEMIFSAQTAGVAVRPYTVNDQKTMAKLFHVNCAAIITDDPLKAYQIREQCRTDKFTL